MGAIKLTYQPDEITANLRIVHKKGCQDLCSQKTKTSDFLGLDCYPFGMLQSGRSFNTNQYSFGFNGMLKDDEITGVTGSHYTAQFWEYDSRIGRRWNVDPKSQISISDYACFKNNPTYMIDPLGDLADRYKVKYNEETESYDTKTKVSDTDGDAEGLDIYEYEGGALQNNVFYKDQKTGETIIPTQQNQFNTSLVGAVKAYNAVVEPLKYLGLDLAADMPPIYYMAFQQEVASGEVAAGVGGNNAQSIIWDGKDNFFLGNSLGYSYGAKISYGGGTLIHFSTDPNFNASKTMESWSSQYTAELFQFEITYGGGNNENKAMSNFGIDYTTIGLGGGGPDPMPFGFSLSQTYMRNIQKDGKAALRFIRSLDKLP